MVGLTVLVYTDQARRQWTIIWRSLLRAPQSGKLIIRICGIHKDQFSPHGVASPAIDMGDSNLYRLAPYTLSAMGSAIGSMESRPSPVGTEGIPHQQVKDSVMIEYSRMNMGR